MLVFLQGFIDSEFGSTKIYKAKKRLELRLLSKKFIDNGYCIEFNSMDYPERKELRKTNLSNYIREKIKRFFNI